MGAANATRGTAGRVGGVRVTTTRTRRGCGVRSRARRAPWLQRDVAVACGEPEGRRGRVGREVEHQQIACAAERDVGGPAIGADREAGGLVRQRDGRVGVAGGRRDQRQNLRRPRYLFAVDLTTWAWIQTIVGLVVLVAGVGVVTGQLWAGWSVSASRRHAWLMYLSAWTTTLAGG